MTSGSVREREPGPGSLSHERRPLTGAFKIHEIVSPHRFGVDCPGSRPAATLRVVAVVWLWA